MAYAGPPPFLALLLGPLVGLGLTAASPAAAQTSLSARILRAEDARELSPDTMALFSEGLEDQNPRVRAQAVRAMGRFESPALIGQIIPLLADADAGVRQAAAVAAANAAQVFPGQAIEALTKAMATAPPADWAVLAASLGRISLPGAADVSAAEQAIAAGLPAAGLRAQVARPTRPVVRPTDPVRVEGAARGLEALARINAKLAPLSADTRSRLFAVVETQPGTATRGLARARRLALLALRNARAVDGELALIAARDPDDEVRRLAMTAVAGAVAPDGASISDADRDAVLRAGLKDVEPRVRLEALRGWGRHGQVRDCQPVLAAVADPNPHVALQAIDLLGAGCTASEPVIARVAHAGGVAASRSTNRRGDLAPVRPCDREPGARRARAGADAAAAVPGSSDLAGAAVRRPRRRPVAGNRRRWSASAPTRTTTSARPRSRSWCGCSGPRRSRSPTTGSPGPITSCR